MISLAFLALFHERPYIEEDLKSDLRQGGGTPKERWKGHASEEHVREGVRKGWGSTHVTTPPLHTYTYTHTHSTPPPHPHPTPHTPHTFWVSDPRCIVHIVRVVWLVGGVNIVNHPHRHF